MPPVIIEDKCTGCEACVAACPSEVLAMDDKLAKVVKPENCLEFWDCIESCAFEAIIKPEGCKISGVKRCKM